MTGCAYSDTPQAANELRFSLGNISEVIISYDEEAITFYEAEGSEMVIKEYMTKNKKAYCAEVKQGNNRIQISEGGKPFFKDGFTRYIEVYLPTSYTKNLTITTTDGDIDLSGISLEMSTLRIDSTNGNTSTSGNLNVKSAVGSGSFKTSNSGKLEVIYTDVMDDLSFFNKNDNIDLTIPKDLEFKFEATSKNGSISTTFEGDMKVEGRMTHGIVGGNPMITIKTETKNGDIQVTR